MAFGLDNEGQPPLGAADRRFPTHLPPDIEQSYQARLTQFLVSFDLFCFLAVYSYYLYCEQKIELQLREARFKITHCFKNWLSRTVFWYWGGLVIRTVTAFSALLPVSRPFRPFIRISVCLLITTAIYCCAFAVSTASAATYYVDDTNGNDACDGSVAQPWKTLSKTQSTVTSGDTAYFRNGSYGVWSAVNVTNTNWITYKAAAGHTPVLSKISINNSVACNSYLVFDGFKMVSGQNKGVWAKNVRYLQLKNLDVSGSVDIMAQDITTHQYPGIKLEN